ncbi:MAG: LamG-like jellyroll fold domain-containing protein [Planctomycetota bacterium]
MYVHAALLCAASIGVSTSQAALVRSFDASADTAGDDIWENTGGNGAAAQNYTFGAPLSPTVVNDPAAPGITSVYEFADGPALGKGWAFFGQAGGGRANNPANTFELIFRLDDVSGTHVLMEIGGAGAGVSMVMQGDTLTWNTNVGGNADPTIAINASGLGTGWHYAVGVWNRNTLTTSFYLDGQLVGTEALAGSTTGWVGGNEGTLGGINPTQVDSVATSFDLSGATTFDGGIALFNYWNEELGAQTIEDNFNAVLIPTPGTALALLGVAAAARRRR